MNRAELDDFFARAEDVLTDWNPSDDAMIATVPADDAADDLAPAGDSYYSQGPPDGWGWVTMGFVDEAALIRPVDLTPFITAMNSAGREMSAHMQQFVESSRRAGVSIARWQATFAAPRVPAIDTGASPRDLALAARRNRNTGPADPRGLDGRYRRRARQG